MTARANGLPVVRQSAIRWELAPGLFPSVFMGLALYNVVKLFTRRANSQTRPPPDKNDPHKLRRLRRPTGPQRAAMRALSSPRCDVFSVQSMKSISDFA
jgi:hypothetical protein